MEYTCEIYAIPKLLPKVEHTMQVLAQDRQANYPRDDTLSTGKCTNHRLTQMGVSVDYIHISAFAFLVNTVVISMLIVAVPCLSLIWVDRQKYK